MLQFSFLGREGGLLLGRSGNLCPVFGTSVGGAVFGSSGTGESLLESDSLLLLDTAGIIPLDTLLITPVESRDLVLPVSGGGDILLVSKFPVLLEVLPMP